MSDEKELTRLEMKDSLAFAIIFWRSSCRESSWDPLTGVEFFLISHVIIFFS